MTNWVTGFTQSLYALSQARFATIAIIATGHTGVLLSLSQTKWSLTGTSGVVLRIADPAGVFNTFACGLSTIDITTTAYA